MVVIVRESPAKSPKHSGLEIIVYNLPSKNGGRFTPQKIHGWNLKIAFLKRKIIFHPPPLLCPKSWPGILSMILEASWHAPRGYQMNVFQSLEVDEKSFTFILTHPCKYIIDINRLFCWRFFCYKKPWWKSIISAD